jgi:hypothetical protein
VLFVSLHFVLLRPILIKCSTVIVPYKLTARKLSHPFNFQAIFRTHFTFPSWGCNPACLIHSDLLFLAVWGEDDVFGGKYFTILKRTSVCKRRKIARFWLE